ncbi:g11676 [Coccomyxa elongata]
MSKNKQKKLKRQAAFEAKKAAKKAEEKAAKRAHQERKLSEVQKMIANMSESERQAWEEQMAQKRQARKQTSQEKRARLQQGQREGQRILIDLDFADKMTHEEVKSLCKQLLYSYSANVRAQKPAQLILTSAEGAIMEQLRKQASGLDNWVVTLHAESYMTAFHDSISDLVYLTADSPNELTELDPSKAYIIGGIVDRNRHKNVCCNKAMSQGISTARLPIDGYLQLNSSFSTVMTVNQVFSILVNYLDHKDWRLALNTAIPQRKRMDDNENEVSENECAHHSDEHIHKKRRTENSSDLPVS